MQVGQQAQPVRPGVRREPAVPREGDLGDGPRPEHAGGEDHVRLVDVERVRVEGGELLGEGARHLAARDADPEAGSAQPRQPAQVGAGQRLLHPQHVQLGQPGRDPPRRGRVQRRARVARHPPALVQVDHDRHGVTDRLARGGDRGQAVVEAARVDPDLEGAEPFVAEPERRRRPLVGRQEHPARGVGRDPVAGPAEERRHREAGDLAGDVPQGRLEGPIAAGVEVDGLERADVPGDGQRVLADEQVLEGLEPVHGVAGADPDHALVGLDPDDRDREDGPWHRVPGRREWRVERDPQPVEPDRRDTHRPGSIADPTRCGTVAGRAAGRARGGARTARWTSHPTAAPRSSNSST